MFCHQRPRCGLKHFIMKGKCSAGPMDASSRAYLTILLNSLVRRECMDSHSEEMGNGKRSDVTRSTPSSDQHRTVDHSVRRNLESN